MSPLAFFALVGAGALSGEVTRFEAVKTKDLKMETILSCGVAEHKYSWCFSALQTVQLLFAPAVKEACWCG